MFFWAFAKVTEAYMLYCVAISMFNAIMQFFFFAKANELSQFGTW